jgi:hypothetical protein
MGYQRYSSNRPSHQSLNHLLFMGLCTIWMEVCQKGTEKESWKRSHLMHVDSNPSITCPFPHDKEHVKEWNPFRCIPVSFYSRVFLVRREHDSKEETLPPRHSVISTTKNWRQDRKTKLSNSKATVNTTESCGRRGNSWRKSPSVGCEDLTDRWVSVPSPMDSTMSPASWGGTWSQKSALGLFPLLLPPEIKRFFYNLTQRKFIILHLLKDHVSKAPSYTAWWVLSLYSSIFSLPSFFLNFRLCYQITQLSYSHLFCSRNSLWTLDWQNWVIVS